MALLIRSAAAAAGLALVAGTGQAADVDNQVWSVAQFNADLGPRTLFTMDTQARFFDDASRLGQVIVRPAVGYRLNDTTNAFVGYAYVRSKPAGRAATHEHRAWQQLTFRAAGDGKGLTLNGRTRVEQRWVEGRDDTGIRFRQQFRLTAPVAGKVRAVATNELFFGLNNTDWGQRDGLHLVRSFVGVSVPVTGNLTVEPGYLNQYVVRRGENAVHHALSITTNIQF